MSNDYNTTMLLAAALSLLASLMHVGVILMGPSWYRLFGAGERFVRAAQAGQWYPSLITAAIALVLAGWASYALSAAGLIDRLPLLRPVLCIITLIYLLRGVLGPFALAGTGRSGRFIVVSSVICLLYGIVHLVGLVQVWQLLAPAS